jgi:hypothetical protein
MNRARLPARRPALVFNVPHPDPASRVNYDVSVGFDEGQPREVFIGCNKLTTAMHTAGLEIATLVSIALQHGATLTELAAAMPRDDRNQPQGAAGAVLDAVIAEVGT